jgi:hypothetical protein
LRAMLSFSTTEPFESPGLLARYLDELGHRLKRRGRVDAKQEVDSETSMFLSTSHFAYLRRHGSGPSATPGSQPGPGSLPKPPGQTITSVSTAASRMTLRISWLVWRRGFLATSTRRGIIASLAEREISFVGRFASSWRKSILL